MTWIMRNIGTVSLLAFAAAAFLSSIAEALPAKYGAIVTSTALFSLAAGRGLVLAAEALAGKQQDDA